MIGLRSFERVTRAAHQWTEELTPDEVDQDKHPFELRNIHPDLPVKVRSLFDDGYFSEATFEAFKFIENEVKRLGKLRGVTGFAAMMKAFDESNPSIRLNSLQSDTDIDEQRGYRHMFAGAQSGIRNPRGHETNVVESPEDCLDHLAVASVLLRKLDGSG
jgi:uncharacterized protein (TIGR02391 family)